MSPSGIGVNNSKEYSQNHCHMQAASDRERGTTTLSHVQLFLHFYSSLVDDNFMLQLKTHQLKKPSSTTRIYSQTVKAAYVPTYHYNFTVSTLPMYMKS